MNAVIYSITSPSGKVYIGQSRNVVNRFYGYKMRKCEGQPALHNSLIKYGYESHWFKIEQELPACISKEILDNYEIFYINQLRAAGTKLLNVRDGGSAGRLSNESRKKISDTLKAKVYTPQEKLRISLIRKNRIVTAETRKKLSDANKRRIYLPRKRESIEKWKASMVGKKRKPISEETKLKISIAQKGRTGRKHTESEKEHLRKCSTGLKLSQEAKEKIRKARSTPITQYDLFGIIIKEWDSAKSAAKTMNLRHASIIYWSKKNSAYKGFIWKQTK